MSPEQIEPVAVTDLNFDLSNPRLVEYDVRPNASEDEIIQVLWDEMDVRELVLSIAASGYFHHEPLIVAREEGKNIVIEGNRRLAAVKLLINPQLSASLQLDVPSVTDGEKDALLELPVVRDTRRNAWRYLGFKHVNGPAKWSSYAKSQYIADVHRKYHIPLDEIARQIGDTHNTVQRLFRSLMVVEQAERLNAFDRNDRWNRQFASSHLYTGLDYAGIGTFLGLRSETEEDTEPVPEEYEDNLAELLLWMYGSRKQDIRPVIRSQNPDLGRLNRVVADNEALAALRAGQDLSVAFDLSRPSENVFEESVYAAKRDLERAHSTLSTGYDGSPNLFRAAEDISALAEDLYEAMKRRRDSNARGTARGTP